MKTCSIDNCEQPVKSRGWCIGHYKRWYRRGNALPKVHLGRSHGEFINPLTAPTRIPSTSDFYWAAGIYEGEGTIRDHPMSICVVQKDSWLLWQLRELFGGTVCSRNDIECGYWTLSGARGRGFIQSIFCLLSPRRQKQALSCFDWIKEIKELEYK